MPVNNVELEQMLYDSATEVFETMFFSAVLGEGPAEMGEGPWVSAALLFHGNPSGRFGVRLHADTGRKIAATFLGLEEEDVTEAKVGEVLCELSNMLCGSVLSRLEPETRFALSGPELNPADADGLGEGYATHRSLEVEEGVLMLWLRCGQTV